MALELASGEPALRHRARAGASVAELKQLIEALKKADPSLVTEVDEAILLGADQVREMSLPQPARPPQDSFLTEEQFQAPLWPQP